MIVTESTDILTANSVNCSKVVFGFPCIEALSAADAPSLINWEKPTRPYHHIYDIFLSIISKTIVHVK